MRKNEYICAIIMGGVNCALIRRIQEIIYENYSNLRKYRKHW